MIYLALAQAVALALAASLLYLQRRDLRADHRTHERRVDNLLDRLAHAERNPWNPAPASEERPEPELPEYDFAPEQAFDE